MNEAEFAKLFDKLKTLPVDEVLDELKKLHTKDAARMVGELKKLPPVETAKVLDDLKRLVPDATRELLKGILAMRQIGKHVALLRRRTGLHGHDLFELIRKETGMPDCPDRQFYLCQRLVESWWKVEGAAHLNASDEAKVNAALTLFAARTPADRNKKKQVLDEATIAANEAAIAKMFQEFDAKWGG